LVFGFTFSIRFMPVEACACGHSSTGLNGRQSLSPFFSTRFPMFCPVFTGSLLVYLHTRQAGVNTLCAFLRPSSHGSKPAAHG
jgi:hypothetical protein